MAAETAAEAEPAQAAARAALDAAIAQALHVLDLGGAASGSQVRSVARCSTVAHFCSNLNRLRRAATSSSHHVPCQACGGSLF